MESKELLDLCRQHGLDVKNQLSTLNPEQREAIVALVHNKSAAAAAPKAPAVPPVLPPKSVPNLTGRPAVLPSRPQAKRESEPAAPPPDRSFPGEAYHRRTRRQGAHSASSQAAEPEAAPRRRASSGSCPSEVLPAAAKAPERLTSPEKPPAPRPQEPQAAPAANPAPHAAFSGRPRRVRTLTPGGQRPSDGGGSRGPLGRGRVPGSGGRPAPVPGGYRVATPPPQKTIRPVEKRNRRRRPAREDLRDSPGNLEPGRAGQDGGHPAPSISRTSQRPRSARFRSFPKTSLTTTTASRGRRPSPAPSEAPAAFPAATPAITSAMQRQDTQDQGGSRVEGRPRGHPVKRRRKSAHPAQAKEAARQGADSAAQGKVPIEMPITVRSLSAAIGKRSGELLFKLMATAAGRRSRSIRCIEPDMAETMALEAGCELDIKRAADAEEELLARPRSRISRKTSSRGRRS